MIGLHPLAREAASSAPRGLACALEDLRAVVGDAFVRADEATRAHWSRSTLPQGTMPAAVVQPASVEEVQAIVRIAARRRLALHPLSTGKNWGYSDA